MAWAGYWLGPSASSEAGPPFSIFSFAIVVARSPVLQWIRVISMGALLVFQLPVVCSTGYYFHWGSNFSNEFPAWCLFQPGEAMEGE